MTWVLFDYVDTLAALEPSKYQVLEAFLKFRYPEASIDINQIRRSYFELEAQEMRSSLETPGHLSRKDFYMKSNRTLLEKLGFFEPGLEEQLFTAFNKTMTHWKLKADAITILSQLSNANYNLGLLSNFDSSLREILNKQGILGFFDAIHISQEVGLEKPSIEFYESFFRKHGCEPGDSIYFGDNLRLDYEPMVGLGVRVILLDEFQFFESNIPLV